MTIVHGCTYEHWISKGNVATDSRWGGRLYISFFRSWWQNAQVKGLLKSVHICQSYHKKTAWVFWVTMYTSVADGQTNRPNKYWLLFSSHWLAMFSPLSFTSLCKIMTCCVSRSLSCCIYEVSCRISCRQSQTDSCFESNYRHALEIRDKHRIVYCVRC